MELDQILALTNQAIEDSQASQAELRSAMGGVMGAQGSQITASRSAGDAKEVISTQEGRGALQAQQGSRAFATTAGTNMASNTEIMTFLGSQMRQAATEVGNKQERVNQIARKSTLGNPLGLLYDAFWGDEARADLEGSQAKLKNASDSLQALNAASQTVAQTQKAIAETETEGTILARAQLARAEADLAIGQIRERQAGTNASLVKAMHSMNREQLGMAVQAYQLRATEENRLAIRADREERQAVIAAEKLADAEFVALVNSGLEHMNLEPVGTRVALKQMYSDSDIHTAIRLGRGLRTGRMSYGSTPGQALVTIQNSPDMQISDVQKPTIRWMQAQAASMEPDTLTNSGVAANRGEAAEMLRKAQGNPAQMEQLVSSYIQGMARLEVSQGLSFSKTDGVYSLPPLDVLQGQTELFQGNAFLEEVVQGVVEAGGNGQFEPSRFITEEVLNKYPTDQIAEGMAAIAQGLYTDGPVLKNLTGAFGLPELQGYPVQVTLDNLPPLFTGGVSRQAVTRQATKMIDVLSPHDWNVFLSDIRARQTSTGLLDRVRQRVDGLVDLYGGTEE